MTRAERLLDLMQVLRRHRHPVAGALLAEELGVSLRTVYRDIASLQAQGAHIEGEAGVGYVLRPGFMLPPLMFSDEELEAIVLGSRWVAKKTDSKLQLAAGNALAKIAAVLPADLRHRVETSTLVIGPDEVVDVDDKTLESIRFAMRCERKLIIHYSSLKGPQSERVIWPIGLGYFDKVRIVIAWCELRRALRHFRADKITECAVLDERYPKPRQQLFKQWQIQHDIATT